MDSELVDGCIGFLLIAAILGYVVVLGIFQTTTNQRCLRAGWRDSEVTWNLERYCVREENEYEITRPLEEVLRNNAEH